MGLMRQIIEIEFLINMWEEFISSSGVVLWKQPGTLQILGPSRGGTQKQQIKTLSSEKFKAW